MPVFHGNIVRVPLKVDDPKCKNNFPFSQLSKSVVITEIVLNIMKPLLKILRSA